MARDATQEFLDTLPEITPEERFTFACHPAVPCFNSCCADLLMPLTPYDMLRLRKALELDSESFLEEYASVTCYPDSNFPLIHLRMLDTPGRPCPFVTEQGCGVYADRSSACRTYPLGRATRPAGNDAQDSVDARYFLVREAHCQGFAETSAWSAASWLADQGLVIYNTYNDRYMRLMARYKAKAGSAPLSGQQATFALLSLYQQDRFGEFILAMRLLERLEFSGVWAQEANRRRILRDEEARLNFAFDWLELVLTGSSATLRPVA